MVSSVCHVGSSVSPAPTYEPFVLQGLSPSIHSIDQIKVVDRFRGDLVPCYFSGRVIRLPSFTNVRNTTRRTHGRPCMVRSRSREGRLRNITSVKLFSLASGTFQWLNRARHSGAGYTFGSGVVHKFLETNGMTHILRAHQLCMEGYASLFDNHLSTVWSAPNYCYRCGNSASILEVSPGGKMYFNVFEAAPENERDGPSQQAAQNAGGKVSVNPDSALL